MKREALRRAKAACRKEGATGCGNIIVEVYKTLTYDPNRPTEGGLLPSGIPPGG